MLSLENWKRLTPQQRQKLIAKRKVNGGSKVIITNSSLLEAKSHSLPKHLAKLFRKLESAEPDHVARLTSELSDAIDLFVEKGPEFKYVQAIIATLLLQKNEFWDWCLLTSEYLCGQLTSLELSYIGARRPNLRMVMLENTEFVKQLGIASFSKWATDSDQPELAQALLEHYFDKLAYHELMDIAASFPKLRDHIANGLYTLANSTYPEQARRAEQMLKAFIQGRTCVQLDYQPRGILNYRVKASNLFESYLNSPEKICWLVDLNKPYFDDFVNIEVNFDIFSHQHCMQMLMKTPRLSHFPGFAQKLARLSEPYLTGVKETIATHAFFNGEDLLKLVDALYGDGQNLPEGAQLLSYCAKLLMTQYRDCDNKGYAAGAAMLAAVWAQQDMDKCCHWIKEVTMAGGEDVALSLVNHLFEIDAICEEQKVRLSGLINQTTEPQDRYALIDRLHALALEDHRASNSTLLKISSHRKESSLMYHFEVDRDSLKGRPRRLRPQSDEDISGNEDQIAKDWQDYKKDGDEAVEQLRRQMFFLGI